MDGLLYIAMRYVHGIDLRTMILRDGPLDPQVGAEIVAQVASALDAAHALGLIHRDIKPANILIEDRDGEPHAFLTDFGLTKHAASTGQLTDASHWVGTVDYVAPEQIEGKPLDARTDVYGLGCVLFEALSGVVPSASSPTGAETTWRRSGPTYGATVWYRIVPPATGTFTVSLVFDTTIGVVQIDDTAPAASGACDTETAGPAVVTLDVTAGTTYYIQVGAGYLPQFEGQDPIAAPDCDGISGCRTEGFQLAYNYRIGEDFDVDRDGFVRPPEEKIATTAMPG